MAPLRSIPSPRRLLDLEPVEVYKADRRSRVWRVGAPGGDVVIKRFEHAPWRQALSLPLGMHPAQRERRRGRRLRRAGLAVVPVIGGGFRAAPRGVCAYLVTPRTGSSIRVLLESGAVGGRSLGAIVDSVSSLFCDLVEAGYFFRDFQLGNILIDDRGAAHLIDVGSVRRSRRRGHAIRMLATLDRTATELGVRRAERLRFLDRVLDRLPGLGSARRIAAEVDGVRPGFRFFRIRGAAPD